MLLALLYHEERIEKLESRLTVIAVVALLVICGLTAYIGVLKDRITSLANTANYWLGRFNAEVRDYNAVLKDYRWWKDFCTTNHGGTGPPIALTPQQKYDEAVKVIDASAEHPEMKEAMRIQAWEKYLDHSK